MAGLELELLEILTPEIPIQTM